jgi:hypothetical protein
VAVEHTISVPEPTQSPLSGFLQYGVVGLAIFFWVEIWTCVAEQHQSVATTLLLWQRTCVAPTDRIKGAAAGQSGRVFLEAQPPADKTRVRDTAHQ